MRRIDKESEPPCLEELRRTPGADWGSVYSDQKQQMRQRSWDEQRGLCAYCMSPLPSPDAKSMKIEHYDSRASAKHSMFDWANLLGVCLGDVGNGEGEDGGRERRFYCDTYRGQIKSVDDQTLYVHPARYPPDAGTRLVYTDAGEICPARDLAPEEQEEVKKTIQRLNLNIDRLMRNRAAVRKKLRQQFEGDAVRGQRLPRRYFEQLLEQVSAPNRAGRLPEYVQVAVVYLKKKMQQASR